MLQQDFFPTQNRINKYKEFYIPAVGDTVMAIAVNRIVEAFIAAILVIMVDNN